MSRVKLPGSKLANFPFRLLPHFQSNCQELERTLHWESEFQHHRHWPTIAIAEQPGGSLSQESLSIQSAALDPKGDYLLVMTPNTILHPSSVFIIKKQLKKHPADLTYWDECSYDPKNLTLSSYFRKGRPSQLSFFGRNVIGSTAVVKAELWKALAGEGLSIAETLWAVSLEAKSTLHIPLSLSAVSIENKESYKSIQLKLAMKLEALGTKSVLMKDGTYGAKPEIELSSIESPLGIVIPFKDQAEKTITSIQAIAKQSGSNKFHLRLINNGSAAEERAKVEAVLKESKFSSASIIDDGDYFNYARLNNRGIHDLIKAGCKDLVLMNNDVELETTNFLAQAQAWSRLPGVGLVGGTLSYPSGAIQSAGINFSQVRPANVTGDNLHADKLREVDGLCFALVLIKDSVIEALGGGLDEVECPNGYGDTLFCQKAREKGFTSLHVPWLRATHHESASRGVRPEELELLELVQNGLRISDLWSDLEAERQPMIIPLGPASSAFQAVVRQVSSSRKLLATAEAVCKPIVKIGKGLRRQLTISKIV